LPLLLYQEFRKAVEAWRNRDKVGATGKSASSSSSSTAATTIVKASNQGQDAQHQSGPKSASTTALALAAKLAADLDSEQERIAQRVQQQKEEAARRLAEAKATQRVVDYDNDDSSFVKGVSGGVDAYDNEDEERKCEGRGGLGYKGKNDDNVDGNWMSAEEKGLCSNSSRSPALALAIGTLDLSSRLGSAVGSARYKIAEGKDADAWEGRSLESSRRGLEVKVVESALGSPDVKTQQSVEAQYFVDEDSDDD
jgi:hypothetical protein